jgi:DNA-binding MarR family transcriptional regulator
LEHLRRITGDHYIVVKLDDKNEKEKGNGSVDVKTLHSLGTSSPMNFYQNNASLNVSGSDSPLDEKNSTIKNEYGDQMEAIGEGTSATKQEPPISPNNLQKDQIQQLTLERDKLKDKIRAMARMDLKEKRKLMTDETRRKMRQLEEQCEKLKRELASAKQEEDGLMTEMESTGMALEDVQEQVCLIFFCGKACKINLFRIKNSPINCVKKMILICV